MKKIINYYQSFGIIETLKKIKRYIYIHLKIRLSSRNTYIPNKKELKSVVLKDKKVYVFSKWSYDKISLKKQAFLKEINAWGFQVCYFYVLGKNNYNKTPFSIQKKYKNKIFANIKISDNDYCMILDRDDYYLFKSVVDKFDSKKIVCFDKKDNYGCDWQKCDEAFYNNISIIVLNHNNENIIQKCLDNLLKYRERYDYEIIVVDNASTDNSTSIIKKYKNVKLYRNHKNGCSSGRNLGVSKATKDFIIFLDSDQWPRNKWWIDNFIEILKTNDKIGAIGWTAGWFNKQGYAFHTVDNFEYRYMPPVCFYRKDIGYIGSGGMMMLKKTFNDIGGFDENYDPTCYEDTDISLKIRNNNKEIIYCPYLGIEHCPHQTTKSGSSKHSALIQKKGNYFVNKWKKENPKLLDYRK